MLMEIMQTSGLKLMLQHSKHRMESVILTINVNQLSLAKICAVVNILTLTIKYASIVISMDLSKLSDL